MKTENGWHIDDRNNRWNASVFTIEKAEFYSKKLINCIDCIDCIDCISCRKCRNCSKCSSCNYCSSCSYCHFCRDCISCRSCNCCISCHDFHKNPQRIVGRQIGIRNDNPCVYWLELGREQCVVGGFRGTLEELKEEVKETFSHNPERLNTYLEFIKNVRAYQEMSERTSINSFPRRNSEKFTPGEWRAEDFNEWDIAGVFVVDKEDNPIAKMCERFVMTPMPGSNFSQLGESKEEQGANALLIAAAPDMYRLLEYLADGVRFGGLQHTDRSLAAEIEKVLKKARGEE